MKECARKKCLHAIFWFLIFPFFQSFNVAKKNSCSIDSHEGKSPIPVCRINEFLEHVGRFTRDDISRLYIFVGPPGTGKTSRVQAFKKWAEVRSYSASSLVSAWQNSGVVRIREIYDEAYKAGDSGKPQIVFLDEIDAIMQGDRGRLQDVFRNSLLELCNQISDEERLKEHPHAIVITIVATNELKAIDGALGNRAEIVEFSLPDAEDREKIIRRYVSSYPHDFSQQDIQNIVQQTDQFSPRELVKLVRLARFFAKRDQVLQLRIEDMQHAIEEVKEEKQKAHIALREQEEKERQARYPYHVDKAQAVNQWAEATKNTGKAVACVAGLGAMVYGAGNTKKIVAAIKKKLQQGDPATLIAIVRHNPDFMEALKNRKT